MGVDHKARAQLAWPILAGIANNKKAPISYVDLGRQIGVHHRAAQYFLNQIPTFCKENNLPPLHVLAVSKRSRLSGGGCDGAPFTRLSQEIEIKKIQKVIWPTQAPF